VLKIYIFKNNTIIEREKLLISGNIADSSHYFFMNFQNTSLFL